MNKLLARVFPILNNSSFYAFVFGSRECNFILLYTIESFKLELWLILLQSKVKDIELKGHTDSVDQLCWDPNHPDTVATAAADKSIRLWDARSKWHTSSLMILECTVFFLAFHNAFIIIPF